MRLWPRKETKVRKVEVEWFGSEDLSVFSGIATYKIARETLTLSLRCCAFAAAFRCWSLSQSSPVIAVWCIAPSWYVA